MSTRKGRFKTSIAVRGEGLPATHVKQFHSLTGFFSNSDASKDLSGHRSPSETRPNQTTELGQSETSLLLSEHEEPEVVQGPEAGRITTRKRRAK